jgi:hypothetical protein
VELTLNLAWLSISAILLLFCNWRARLSGTQRDRRLILLSLLCVAGLLFPVISMTDDLNSSPALPEASKLKRIGLSTQVAVALLSRIVLQAVHDRTWTAMVLQVDSRAPLRELLTFQLNRRPPPSTDLLS